MAAIDLMENLDGIWARPFVTDGNPLDINAAIIGLNPATPIGISEVPDREDFFNIITNRTDFEQLYMRVRMQRGQREYSRSRSRLRLIIEQFDSSIKFAETNVNSFPTSDGNELHQAVEADRGAEISEAYLRQIQPSFVIIHNDETLEIIQKFEFVDLGRSVVPIHEFANHHVGSHWNGQPIHVFSIPGLAARTTGWSNEAIKNIMTEIIKIIGFGNSSRSGLADIINALNKIGDGVDQAIEGLGKIKLGVKQIVDVVETFEDISSPEENDADVESNLNEATDIVEAIGGIVQSIENVVNVVDAVTEAAGELDDIAPDGRGTQDRVNWLDLEIEAVQGIDNPFHGTVRPHRHELLLQQDEKITIRRYQQIIAVEGLNRFSQNFINQSINHGCVRVYDIIGNEVSSVS